MDSRTRRATSPGSRRIAHGESASTGALTFPSAFDPYPGPSRFSFGFTSGPRTSAERVGASSVLPRYRPASPPRQSSRDDYVVRPRRMTLDVPDPPPPRRPLSYVPPSSPSRARPTIITTAVENPLAVATRPRHHEDYYIQPASTASSRREHRRNYTHGSIDTTRIGAGEQEARDRWDHGIYRSNRGAYNTDQPYYRAHPFDERNPGYEIIDRREPIYRNAEPGRRIRRESNAGRPERPISMTGLEDYLPRINPPSREPGPPPAMDTRGFHTGGRSNLGRSGSLTHGHLRPETELPREYVRDDYDASQPRKSSRGPIVHQDYPEDYPAHRREVRDSTEGRSHKYGGPSIPEPRKEMVRNEDLDEQYGRTIDDRSTKYHDRGHHRGHDREDRDHRIREESRSHGQEISANGLIASAAASAAGAGVVAESSRRRRHRHDRNKEDGETGKGRVRGEHHDHRKKKEDSLKDSSNSSSTSSSSEDDDGAKRERRERHRRHRRHPEAREEDVEESRNGAGAVASSTTDNAVHEGSLREKLGVNELPRIEDASRSAHRHHRHHSRTQEKDSYSEDSSSNSEGREKKARQVRVVTPSEEPRAPDPPIKGILRPPREKFPEDPAPVREGVAPPKDSGKKGIPPNARWTKIDRKLVNPEALVAGNERFEERTDHVIVLRVLTKEDIEAYALKTQEIRAMRGIPAGIVHEGAHRYEGEE